MAREAKKYLFDAREAAKRIATFTASKSLGDYRRDDLLKSAVERQFEIIGEALAQLHKVDPAIASQVPDYQRIIAFRNILIQAMQAFKIALFGVWSRLTFPHSLIVLSVSSTNSMYLKGSRP